MIKINPVFILFPLLSLLFVGCDKSQEMNTAAQKTQQLETLRVGFPPDENPQEIINKNKPLLEYIKRKTGIQNVELSVPKTYTAAVEEMARGNLDMVYFGGLTYVLAKKDVDITPIVRGKSGGTADNHTFIVTKSDSGIATLDDLIGKTFAFGDVASTSGHLIPHQALLQKGIDPTKDFSKVDYTGAHDKTALAVYEGKVQAGAMNARKLPAMIDKGQIDKNKIKVIWKSEPFADYPWAVLTKLGPDMIQKLRKAFIEIDDPAILKALRVDGYEATSDKDFEVLRDAAIKLGFMD